MDSNHRPTGYEPAALTTELHPHVKNALTDESIAERPIF